MNILFIQKNIGMVERLGVMSLSSVAKALGHKVDFVIVDDMSFDEVLAHVKRFDPQIIGFSIMTGEHTYHIDLNLELKRHFKFFSLFGGPHPTFMPDMIGKDGVDALCVGEGENAFRDLLTAMAEGRDFTTTSNMIFKMSSGEIKKNPLGPLIEDLDSLPLPDRALMYETDKTLAARGTKLFMSMRGCPYPCTYCFNHSYNAMTKGKGTMLRYRSVSSLIGEIKAVQQTYPLDTIWIDDDTFLIKPDGWLEEFAERLPKEIGLEFSCNIRPNVATRERIRLLKKAGCKYLWMGVECGNNEVAKRILKRQISNDAIVDVCKHLHESKIRFYTQNLIGLPVDDPLKVDFETLDFNILIKPHFGWSSILYPYPETEIGKMAMDMGMFDNDFEKIHVSNKTTTALKFKDPKIKRQLVNLHKLFGVTVAFPVLRPLVPFLIKLPLERLYTYVFFAWYGYSYILKGNGWRYVLKSLPTWVRFYFRYLNTLEKPRWKIKGGDASKVSYPAAAAPNQPS